MPERRGQLERRGKKCGRERPPDAASGRESIADENLSDGIGILPGRTEDKA